MEEDEQEEEDDSQALSQEPLPEAPQEEDTAPAYLVRDSGIPPLRAVGMMKAMQLAGGDDYIQATLDADKRLGTDRLRLKVYSERTGEQPGRRGSNGRLQILHDLHVKHSLIALREPHPSRTLPCSSPHLPT